MKFNSTIRPSISINSRENALLKRTKTEDYKNYQSPFYATLSMFREYVNYTTPLSYDEWLAAAPQNKAAILYVQFFEQISLAWYKLRTDAAIEEECVEEVIQYLLKNVDLIIEDPKRFRPGYIYKVVYNCIYCKSMDPYKGQTAKSSWYNNTTSQYIRYDGEELDLFDLTADSDSDLGDLITREQFWAIIEDMGEDTLSVVSKLLGDGMDPDHKVNKAGQIAIIEQLREKLAPFKEAFYI